MNKSVSSPVAASAEFYFEHKGEQYTVSPTGWTKNGCDVFDISDSATEEIVGSITVSPLEEVSDAFAAWSAAAS